MGGFRVLFFFCFLGLFCDSSISPSKKGVMLNH